ncbi:MAG: class I SAM-dependent methyltransferase [Defluviitaleaceae bacterium]|nr:class I SAM-dependent methyltransferase [Defluviitaleaceae bacterium]
MRFSQRLKAIFSLVDGDILADIGTDHAFLPINACRANIVKRAIACDVSSGPLKIAAQNIQQYDLSDKIDVRLGFGLQPLQPNEADCIVIAGLGGINIIQILEQLQIQPLLLKNSLILQPQRDLAAVKLFLAKLNIPITAEITAHDRNREYPIIKAQKQPK